MLQGQRLALELDIEKVDPYGGLLVYAWLSDGSMFNETLVREGYAQVATFPPNVKYTDRFLGRPRGRREQPTGACGACLQGSYASRRIGATALVVGALTVPLPVRSPRSRDHSP